MSGFAAHCESQASSCATLGSPFTARLCQLFATRLGPDHPVGTTLHGWEAPGPDALALRLAGGLHALAMATPESRLAKAYPPHQTDDDTLWQVVDATLREEAEFLLAWLRSPPQTNEIRRCCGLIPAFHWMVEKFDLPLRLSEIGASAGLNMNWDRYALKINEQVWGPEESPVQLSPEWRGPLPPHKQPRIAHKAGCDLNPLNPNSAADRARLHAYIWPDQPERHANTRAALDMASTAPEKQDAQAFIARRLEGANAGDLHVIYHSIVWQYLPPEAQAAASALISKAGEATHADAPLAWLSIEADETAGSAAIVCRIWPSGEVFTLGRIDFHGRWVAWQPVRNQATI